MTSDKNTVELQATLKAQGSTTALSDVKAGQGIAAVGLAGLSVPLFVCTGLPFVVIFALLANANRRGLRIERQHQESLAVQQQ